MNDWTGKTQTKCRQSPEHQCTGRDAIVGCHDPLYRTLPAGPTVPTSHTFHDPVHVAHRYALATVLIQCYGSLYASRFNFLGPFCEQLKLIADGF